MVTAAACEDHEFLHGYSSVFEDHEFLHGYSSVFEDYEFLHGYSSMVATACGVSIIRPKPIDSVQFHCGRFSLMH